MTTSFQGAATLAGAAAVHTLGLVQNFPVNFPADETEFVLRDDDPITEGATYLVDGVPTVADDTYATAGDWAAGASAVIRFFNYRKRATLLPNNQPSALPFDF